MTLSLPGISLFYCIVCGVAFIVTYFILPETENISLEDIERHFTDNSKKITDRKIVKSNEQGSRNVDGGIAMAERSFRNEMLNNND